LGISAGKPAKSELKLSGASVAIGGKIVGNNVDTFSAGLAVDDDGNKVDMFSAAELGVDDENESNMVRFKLRPFKFMPWIDESDDLFSTMSLSSETLLFRALSACSMIEKLPPNIREGAPMKSDAFWTVTVVLSFLLMVGIGDGSGGDEPSVDAG